MAKKNQKPKKSRLSRHDFFLDEHDEEKLLLFSAGLVFGIGLAVTILELSLYTGIVALAIGYVLLFLENRIKRK